MHKLSAPYTPYQVVDQTPTTLRTYLAPYLRKWPWFVGSLALALAGAYLYMQYKQPVYRIEASLMIQDENKGNQPASPLKELEGYSPRKVVENELEVLTSAMLMGRVVDKLHLDTRYFKKASFGKREVYDESPVWVFVEAARPELYAKMLTLRFPTSQTVQIDNQTYPINQAIKTPNGRLRLLLRKPVGPATGSILVQAMPRSSAIGLYRNGLKVATTSKTSTVVRLTLDDAVPKKGEAIMNTLINEYNQAAITDNTKMASNTLKFVENRLRIVAGELASVEKNVEQYKSTLGITDLSAQAQSVLQTTQQNDTQLNQIGVQLATLSDLQKFVNAQGDKRGSTPATVGISDPVLLGQIDKLAQLELERDQLAQTAAEKSPLLQTVDSQIKATKNNIGQNVKTMKSMLLSSQKQYTDNNQQLTSLIRTLPKQERGLMDVTRQQSIKNDLYTYLLQKREEMAVMFAAALADSRVIDPPTSSDFPIKPVGAVIYALFSLVGLLVPAGFIAGRSALNTRVLRRNDVENGTHVPILGEIMKRRHSDPLVVSPNNRSVIAEQIRTIRTSIRHEQAETAENQVLLCTSSISGEGKSFISLNLGASLALLQHPTVIIEMDMRLPRLHQSFNLDNSVGLSTYLDGEATIEEILQPVPGHPNYYMIPSGPLPQNPSELLSSPTMKQLIRLLRERFQHIILDAPPIGIVTDAEVVAHHADTTLFVVRHGVTPKQSLKTLDQLDREQRFKNMRIILNGVDTGESYHSNRQRKNSYSYR